MESLRTDPFGSDDYEDGEWYRLIRGSRLDVALRSESWVNHSERSRRNWIRLMNNVNATFVGTIISSSRRQLQLMVVLELTEGPNRKWMAETVVSLNHFDRFL